MLLFEQARGREAIVAGFYHEGYEEPLLMLMKRRGVHSGLVVKVETLPFIQLRGFPIINFVTTFFKTFFGLAMLGDLSLFQ